MYIAFSRYCVEQLIENKSIKPEDAEIYCYGFQVAILMGINISFSLIVGLLMHMFWQSVVVTLSFLTLRTYAGGYHASNEASCFVLSQTLHFLILLLTRGILLSPFQSAITLMAHTIGAALILLLAPVSSPRRTFDNMEKIVYRRRSIIFLLVHIAIMLIAQGYNAYTLAIIIAFSDLFIGVSSLAGKLFNSRQFNSHEAN